MKTKLVRYLVLVTAVTFLFSGISIGEVSAQVPTELALFEEIPVVFAASKRIQPVTEAAASVEIITAEDIRQSGAINIADVLRKVAGVEVREPSVSSHAIGIRGFCDSQHVLITLDGDSTYLQHVNHTYTDFIPVDLEEIERIEVIKGPSSLFYGGAAFSGVINIVTKTPKEINGTQITAVGGDWDTVRTNIIHGGSYKKLDYSLSLGHFESEYMSPKRAPWMKTHTLSTYGGARAIYHIDEESSVSAVVRHRRSDDGISRMCTPRNTHVSLRYDRPDFWIRLFFNNQYKKAFSDAISVDDTNYELEAMRVFHWGKNTTSISGFAKKTDFIGKGLLTDKEYKNDVVDYAIKGENEFRATDQLIFTLGGRAEYYSEVEFVGLGRGSVIYKPTENHGIRLTVGNSYYLPSVTQLYGGGEAIPLFLANKSLKQEKIMSYELAYFGNLTKRIMLEAAAFYNDYSDLIANRDGIAPPENEISADQRGLEAGLNFLIAEWLTGYINYTYMKIHRSDFGDLAVDPRNMVNLGLRAKVAKWSANLAVHYVDKYYEIYDHSNPVLGLLTEPQKIDPYTTVNLRIAFQPNDYLEFAVAALNMFNDVHYESNPTGLAGSDKLHRRITGEVRVKF